jgi:hypothetical protein
MANYRQIHVSIWKDEWFLDLEPRDKLLFIYLFSNENASLSGLYKLPMKVIAFETGLEVKYITDALARFSKANKVHYENGIVWVVNMRRYHETKSSKVQQRISNDIVSIPDCPLKIRYQQSMDTETQLKEEEDKKENEEENKQGILVPLVEAFCKTTNIPEMSLDYRDYDALNEMQAAGVTPGDMLAAIDILRQRDYTISGPASVKKTAISEMSKRTSGPPGGAPGSPQVLRISGGAGEVVS